MPYKYSGKNFNFVENEENILQHVRRWCKEFKNSDIVENLLSSMPSTESDTNLLCKVMKVYEDEEDVYQIRVKDKDGKSWHVQVDRIKYPELRSNEIIRIKSAKTNVVNGESVLELRPHSNILRFMKDSRIEKNLSK